MLPCCGGHMAQDLSLLILPDLLGHPVSGGPQAACGALLILCLHRAEMWAPQGKDP